MNDEHHWDWVGHITNRSFLKVHRAHISHSRGVVHEISTWHHSMLPDAEDQETPPEWQLVLTLKCLRQQDEEEHKLVIPVAKYYSRRLSNKELQDMPVQGRKADYLILDDEAEWIDWS